MLRVTATEPLKALIGGKGCVLVPTMGALHEGHRALVRLGRSEADARRCPLVVSIFVNPDQFNDQGDLRSYPRPIDQDLALLSAEGTDIAFTPDVAAMYPAASPTAAPQPAVPDVGVQPGLEDAYRPGHFKGVCRVVSRLFDLCGPSAAVFGAKDWQQCRVVGDLCQQQGRPTDIVVGPTVRESDGLALSSRNQHLDADARERAPAIWRGFQLARLEPGLLAAEAALRQTMDDAGFAVEYATIRDAQTLMRPVDPSKNQLRMFAAGSLGGVRLLDNEPWPA